MRKNYEHRYHGEVLHDEQADHDSAGKFVGDACCGEHLKNDGCAGDRDDGAEPDCFADRHESAEAPAAVASAPVSRI